MINSGWDLWSTKYGKKFDTLYDSGSSVLGMIIKNLDMCIYPVVIMISMVIDIKSLDPTTLNKIIFQDKDEVGL